MIRAYHGILLPANVSLLIDMTNSVVNLTDIKNAIKSKLPS